MKNIKMKTKLIMGFCVPVLLTIITVLTGVYINKEIRNRISAMNEEGAQEVSGYENFKLG